MKTTDTSEAGLETTIVKSLIEEAGYQAGNSQDYDRAHAVDLAKLTAFIQEVLSRQLQSASDLMWSRLKEHSFFIGYREKSPGEVSLMSCARG